MGRRTDNPVGTYTLTAPERFTNHYEFAAWYQEIEVQPGSYPVHGWIEDGRVKYFLVTLPGFVTTSDFSPHFGGVPFASKHDEDKGQAASHSMQVYDYLVFESIHKDPASRWKIDLAALPHIGQCIDCGAPVTLYGKERRCPHCGVKEQDRQEAEARRRWPRLVALVGRIHSHLGAYLVNQYVQDRRDPQNCGYHKKQVQIAISLRDTNTRRLIAAELARELSSPGWYDGKNYHQTQGAPTDPAAWTITREDWRWTARAGRFVQGASIWDKGTPHQRARLDLLREVTN